MTTKASPTTGQKIAWKWHWHRWMGVMFGPLPVALIGFVAILLFAYLK